MDTYVDEDAIRQLAQKLAKDIKTEERLLAELCQPFLRGSNSR